jgi:hypothetical protein
MTIFQHQRAVLLLLTGVLMGACSPFTSQRSPIILILLESFSEQDYLCAGRRRTEDFNHLQSACDDFIRYTHAYAPTTLTQPNLASLLTGLPLSQHQVHHNGPQGISHRIQTLAEEALGVGMRTAFFSGGVPLAKKFGVGQGYEFFHEPFGGGKSQFFLPFDQLVEQAIQWLDRESQKEPFFLTLYAPDLLYENRTTVDGLDNERPMGRSSSVIEIHETINNLIGELKKRKRWQRLHFIVMGVSGPKTNLRSANPLSGRFMHVPLQIKPSSQVNTNLVGLTSELLSFAKLGGWIQRLILHQPRQGDLIFPPEPSEKFIPQQNTWEKWLGLRNWQTRGLRRKQYLFSFNPNLEVYDTFFDKNEYEPVLSSEGLLLAEKFNVFKQMSSFFADYCEIQNPSNDCPQRASKDFLIRQLALLYQWQEEVQPAEQPGNQFRDRLSVIRVGQQKLAMSWLAFRAVYEKRWTDLFELGKINQRSDWLLVAQLNLREVPRRKPQRCLSYFVGETRDVDEFYQHCENAGLRRVVEGLSLLKNKKRPSDSFWMQVNKIKTRRAALSLNLAMRFVNDLREPFDFAPSLSELYFFLPENSQYLQLIEVDKT